MVSERNRIIELKKYLESIGISVNIAKNKARGNRGIFIRKSNVNRIDIAQNLSAQEELSALVHEFAHHVHYKYDKTLKSLDFIFGNCDEAILEELRNVTVESIPKKFAESLFVQKEDAKNEIKSLVLQIKDEYPDFQPAVAYKKLENRLRCPVKYLLSYDKVRFFNKVYSVDILGECANNLLPNEINYIKLKSKQRLLRRINSKISKLNSYYNNPSELFARFMEMFMLNSKRTEELAPIATSKFKLILKEGSIEELSEFNNIYSRNLNI